MRAIIENVKVCIVLIQTDEICRSACSSQVKDQSIAFSGNKLNCTYSIK